MKKLEMIKRVWRNQLEAEANCSPIRERITREDIDWLISELDKKLAARGSSQQGGRKKEGYQSRVSLNTSFLSSE